MSPVAACSGVDCENKVLNSESAEVVKNGSLPNDNIGKGDRKQSNYPCRFFTKWHK